MGTESEVVGNVEKPRIEIMLSQANNCKLIALGIDYQLIVNGQQW